MGVNSPEETPEKKLARRVFEKEKLNIPFDLEKLANKYAEVSYRVIPIEGVDGVCLNLKVPGKKPRIIVNSRHSLGRQRFTLAHELGHVIIPWHLGTIIDDIYGKHYKEFAYGLQEQEANAFAAELLMPKSWVASLYKTKKGDLAAVQANIVKDANVSEHAAAIAMLGALSRNIIYAAVDGGIVLHSGKTGGTMAFPPSNGIEADKNFYPYQKDYFLFNGSSFDYCWWNLNVGINTTVNDQREWREILASIIADIKPKQGESAFIMSLSGIIGSAKSKLRGENYSIDALTTAILYRIRREGFEDFTNHKDFETFVKKRAEEIYKKGR